MTRSLIPWTQLTRLGVPEFKVCRAAIETQGQRFEVGSSIPADVFVNKIRLRQMYEQRRIEPVNAPPNTRQAHRERSVPPPSVPLPALPILPTIPVDLTGQKPFDDGPAFDAPAVPVVEERTSSRTYTPARKRKGAKK